MRAAIDCYRILLLAYPRRFRTWAGGELERAFAQRLEECRGAGLKKHLGLWRRTLADVFANAAAERCESALESGTRLKQKISAANETGETMNSIWQDLRYALRLFSRSPGFVAVATLSLAFGIGINTAVFSLTEAALLRDLPVKQPDRLVIARYEVSGLPPRTGHNGRIRPTPDGLRASTSLPYPFFERIRERTRTLDSVFTFAEIYAINLGVQGGAEMVDGLAVSGAYFDSLGLRPSVGRLLGPGDDSLAADPAVVLSDGLWRRRFGADPACVGSTIQLNGHPFVIAGVAPPAFHGTLQVGQSPALYVPMAQDQTIDPGADPLDDVSSWWTQVMGRLRQGATFDQAQAELEVEFLGFLADNWPDYVQREQGRLRMRAVSGAQGMTEVRESLARPLAITQAIGAMVLLIACANLANVMLARGSARRRELALRVSLGALRRRLVRQLMTESLVLSVVGAACGLILARLAGGAFLKLLPSEVGSSLVLDTSLNVPVLLFAALAAMSTAFFFGLAPAWMVSRLDPSLSLHGSRDQAPRTKSLASRSLVVSQVALALALLIVAGLLGRTLNNLVRVDTGFKPDNLLVFRVDPTLNGYRGEALKSLYERLREGIEGVVGVESAALSPFSLLSGSGSWTSVDVDGHEFDDEDGLRVHVHAVSTSFLKTMRIPVAVGRDLTATDGSPGIPGAVVNETFARAIQSSGAGVGRRFRFGRSGAGIEIVGVSRDAKNDSIRGRIMPTIYLPYSLAARLGGVSFSVRVQPGAAGVMDRIRKAAAAIEPNLPLSDVKTMRAQIAESLHQERQFALLTATFGLTGLLLAGLGLYGTLSHAVGRRRREFGVRLAMGARRGDLTRLVMREMALVGIGVVLGLAAAWGGARFIGTMLFGLSPMDPLTVAASTLVMLAVAGASSYLPARRAASLDPVQALRCE